MSNGQTSKQLRSYLTVKREEQGTQPGEETEMFVLFR